MTVKRAAGQYRTRCTVYSPTRTANDYNEPVVTYTNRYCQFKGKVVPSSGREFLAAQQVNAQVSAIIRTYRDSKTRDITTDMRIGIADGASERVVNIAAVYDEQDANREMVLWCTEVE